MRTKKAAVPVVSLKTKYLDRLIEALTLLCGGNVPPREMVHAWESSDDDELQHWAVSHTKLPWAMGIGTIEAAQVLADTPEEGQEHELRDEAYPSEQPYSAPSPIAPAFDLSYRISHEFGEDWALRLTSSGSGNLVVPGGTNYFNSAGALDDLLNEPRERDDALPQS